MRKKKYYARENSPYTNVDAQIIGGFIYANFQDGKVNPKDLLKIAKNSEIHTYFEWNDKEAAQKYRVKQARDLINCVYISVKGSKVRAYEKVFIKEDKGKSYQDFETIKNTPLLASQVLERALRELDFFQEKYHTYSELLPVFEATKRIKKTVNL